MGSEAFTSRNFTHPQAFWILCFCPPNEFHLKNCCPIMVCFLVEKKSLALA